MKKLREARRTRVDRVCESEIEGRNSLLRILTTTSSNFPDAHLSRPAVRSSQRRKERYLGVVSPTNESLPPALPVERIHASRMTIMIRYHRMGEVGRRGESEQLRSLEGGAPAGGGEHRRGTEWVAQGEGGEVRVERHGGGKREGKCVSRFDTLSRTLADGEVGAEEG